MSKSVAKLKFISFCSVAVSMLVGCQNENLFETSNTNDAYKASFVVKDVSPDMDWKTTSKASVSVSVDGVQDIPYTVQLFDENPLISSVSAKLLASGYAKNNLKFITEIDYPIALKTVYVCRIDEAGRRIVKPVAINDGMIETSFTDASSNLSNVSRSIAQVEEVNYNVAPYTNTEINAMLTVATELKSNEALDDTNKHPKNYAGNTVAVIKLTDAVYNGDLKTNGTNPTFASTRLIITGNCMLNSVTTIKKGVEIIVVDGGSLIVNGGPNKYLIFNENSALTIMPGASVSVGSGSEIKSQTNGSCKIYNGAYFSFTGQLTLGSGTFINASGSNFTGATAVFNGNKLYNYGNIGVRSITADGGQIHNQENASLSIESLTIKNTNGNNWITNNGTISAKTIRGKDAVNIDNSNCLYIVDSLEVKTLITNQLSYVTCDNLKTNEGGSVNLGGSSMVYVRTSAGLYKTNISGPQNDDWALLKIKSISEGSIEQPGTNTTITKGYIANNLYCEYDNMVRGNSHNPSTGYDWLIAMINGHGNTDCSLPQNTAWVGNAHSCIARFGEAPINIPAGGGRPGNIPTGYVPPSTSTPITYTYAFEDNFPLMGDYDFNDVVMDINWTETRNHVNAVTGIIYNITLAAVGATRNLGGGLRLVGVDKTKISSIEFSGDVADFQNTLSGEMFYPLSNGFEGSNSDVVIPLFEDAHNVLMGSSIRKVCNTNINKTLTTTPRTLTMTIKFNMPQLNIPISKDNLDFFVAYNTSKQTPDSRTEIHLYEFRDIVSPVAINNSTVLASVANYPWAISVPEFRYPIERVCITTAYPGFSTWAQAPKADRHLYEDWYTTVSSNTKVFR